MKVAIVALVIIASVSAEWDWWTGMKKDDWMDAPTPTGRPDLGDKKDGMTEKIDAWKKKMFGKDDWKKDGEMRKWGDKKDLDMKKDDGMKWGDKDGWDKDDEGMKKMWGMKKDGDMKQKMSGMKKEGDKDDDDMDETHIRGGSRSSWWKRPSQKQRWSSWSWSRPTGRPTMMMRPTGRPSQFWGDWREKMGAYWSSKKSDDMRRDDEDDDDDVEEDETHIRGGGRSSWWKRPSQQQRWSSWSWSRPTGRPAMMMRPTGRPSFSDQARQFWGDWREKMRAYWNSKKSHDMKDDVEDEDETALLSKYSWWKRPSLQWSRWSERPTGRPSMWQMRPTGRPIDINAWRQKLADQKTRFNDYLAKLQQKFRGY